MRTESRRFRLILFGLIYFAQGAGLAYFRNFQKPYLDSLGFDADLIGGLTTILLLPFILKIFIGMLSDRVSLFGQGHRKPYIIVGLLLAAAAFAAAAFFLPDRNFTLFAVFIVLGSFSVALFDSTSDGLAIDITPEEEQGLVQGVMTGSRAGGFIVQSLVFGLMVGSTGYRAVFIVVAVMMLAPLWWARQIEEPAERDLSQSFSWSGFADLGKGHLLLFIAYAVIYSIASFGVDGLVTFYLSKSFSATGPMIGNYAALRGAGAVLGAVLGGLAITRMGRSAGAYIGLGLVSLGALALGFLGSAGAIILFGLGWGFAWGFQETIFVALSMSVSDRRVAASMFAIFMAISNLGSAVGEGMATGLTDNIGFSPVFLILAGINLVCFPLLYGMFRWWQADPK